MNNRMFITTRRILDMETLRTTLVHEGYGYTGLMDFAKGDSTAKAAETSQQTFDTSLQNIFQQQYATQSSNLAYLTAQLKPQIDAGGTGYTPAQLAAQRTGATDANSTQFQNAQDALNNQVSQRSGGSKLTGVAGATTEADAGLLNSAAQTEAGSQEQITANNANLQQSNYWNAVNGLNGIAAQQNPLGYAGASTSGSGAVAGLSQAYTASNQSQLLGALGGMASGVGSALGGAFSGGLLKCWVAAALYGWHSIKTHVIRSWMTHSAPAWFQKFYINNGAWIARTPFRFAFLPFFESVLRFA